jgi:hypothetical protein
VACFAHNRLRRQTVGLPKTINLGESFAGERNMHDKDIIELLAAAIQRQYDKEVKGEILKWEKRPSAERSQWRSVAREALIAFDRHNALSPSKVPQRKRQLAKARSVQPSVPN